MQVFSAGWAFTLEAAFKGSGETDCFLGQLGGTDELLLGILGNWVE